MLQINSVNNGNCLELMSDIDDKSIDMILCDLPYGTTACKWDTVIPFEPLWSHYKRIIKDNGAIVLTASQPFTSALVMSNIKMFKYEWIWVKNRVTGFTNAKKRPLKNYEDILIFSNGTPRYFPQDLIRVDKVVKNSNSVGGDTMGLTVESDQGKRRLRTFGETYIQQYTNYPRQTLANVPEGHAREHPTQKPVALFEYLIKTYTNEGELVLDNCAGSGTTAIACLKTNRNYILIEQESKYCEVANRRIAAEFMP